MPKSRRTPPHLRRICAFVLLTGTLLLSGCVYLRLLDLKKQLSQFDTFFKADTSDGVRIDCLEPLLLTDDVRWLGIYPETISKNGPLENWRVRWVKEPPPGEPESLVFDVELDARFTGERLSFVAIPERYFAFFPKELFVNLLRSTGQARIDRGSRSANVENSPPPESPAIKPPTIESIGGMLGRPNERLQRGSLDIFRYRYRPQTTEKKARSIEVTFAFEAATGQMQTLVAKLPTGTINFQVASKEKP